MVDDRPPGPEHSPGGDRPPPSPEGAPVAQPQVPHLPEPPPYAGGLRAYERGRPIPIREMRLGELLDAAIKIYRLYWKTFLAIASYILVPLAFLQSFLTRSQLTGFRETLRGIEPSEPSLTAGIASLVSILVMYLFVIPFLTAAFAKVTADLYMGGEPSVAETYRFALHRTRSILWVSILVGLATFGGVLLLVIPALIFYFRFVFSPVTVVAENLRGTDAMRRSWRLAKGSFWKIFGTVFLAGLLARIIAGLVSFIPTAAALFLGPSAWPLAALGTSIGQVLTMPFATIVIVLLYFDMRIRKEGLDLALMVEEMSATGR